MAKDSNILYVKDPIAHNLKVFKRQLKAARQDLKMERRAFYDRVASLVRKRVIFSQDYAGLGDDKGFPMIAKVEVNRPGEIRVIIYLLKSGSRSGDVISRTQNEICKERSLWFKPLKDTETKKRYLHLETDGDKKWEVKESNYFQTIIIKTKVVPNQAELDRLFDPDPLKIIVG